MGIALILRVNLSFSQIVRDAFSVNNVCISNRCRKQKICYDVHSSLKERSGQQQVKLKLFVFRIIPGDWGKVESGWLTRLLLNRPKGRRRRNSPVPLARSRVPVTRKRELGGEGR